MEQTVINMKIVPEDNILLKMEWLKRQDRLYVRGYSFNKKVPL